MRIEKFDLKTGSPRHFQMGGLVIKSEFAGIPLVSR